MKLCFMVFPDGTTNVTSSNSLEEVRAELEPEEGEEVFFLEHSKEGDRGLEIILGAHYIALDGQLDSALEHLATTLVRAGMEIERREMMHSCIGRTLQP